MAVPGLQARQRALRNGAATRRRSTLRTSIGSMVCPWTRSRIRSAIRTTPYAGCIAASWSSNRPKGWARSTAKIDGADTLPSLIFTRACSLVMASASSSGYGPPPMKRRSRYPRKKSTSYVSFWSGCTEAGGTRRRPVIQSQNPHLRQLDAVVGDMEALAALRRGAELSIAYEISRPSSNVFEEALMAGQNNTWKKARSALSTGYRGSRKLLRIAEAVADLADDLQGGNGAQEQSPTQAAQVARVTYRCSNGPDIHPPMRRNTSWRTSWSWRAWRDGGDVGGCAVEASWQARRERLLFRRAGRG